MATTIQCIMIKSCFKFHALKSFAIAGVCLLGGNLYGDSLSYMGTATCASSNCHGSTTARPDANILYNEHTTWARHDRHSKSWQTLTSEESKRIAHNLGLGNPAEEKLCLDCHSTFVPPDQRGEKHNFQDGVSCESCHGPAEQYLKSHSQPGTSHQDNMQAGLTDLVDLHGRAQLCLSCHYGTEDKVVNHRLIGAGHPRLSFELDTFLMIQPPHWEQDQDYEERKGAYDPAKSWLVGQFQAALAVLEALQSMKRSTHGQMPELALFNCYSCHHQLSREEWKKHDYEGNPGELRLNVAHLQVLAYVLPVLETGRELRETVAALRRSYGKGTPADIAELSQYLKQTVSPRLDQLELSAGLKQKMLRELLHLARDRSYLHFEEAEQVTMGVAALLSSDRDLKERHKGELEKMYDALKDIENYDSQEFKQTAASFFSKLAAS